MKSIPNPISLINEENLEIIYVETDDGTKRYAREKGSVGTFKRYKTKHEMELEQELRQRRIEAQLKSLEEWRGRIYEAEAKEKNEEPKRYGYPKKKKKGWFS